MNNTNYDTIQEEGGAPVKLWTKGVPVEDGAKRQLLNVSKLPFIYKHIAVMPDVHIGKGATIGSVIATKGAVIPAAVGVDLGCGCMAVKTTLTANDLPGNLATLRSIIESKVPHGRTDNGGSGDRGSWGNIPDDVGTAYSELEPAFKVISDKYPKIKHQRSANQLGSLGTGNHFLSSAFDEDNNVWMMLHSGSRGIGNVIGSHFIELAKKDMRRYFINLPDQDLAYLPQGSDYYDDYIQAVSWAQRYAMVNRKIMMDKAIKAMKNSKLLPEFYSGETVINCHHNYLSTEHHYGDNVLITRKGAVSAREGQMGLIPGTMAGKSYIVRGKGNLESFTSCSHGAGRKMSRAEARKTFTLADHRVATEGVECRKDKDVIDETPGAYKDIDAVMAAQSDLVDVIHTLKEFMCIKG